MKIIFSMRAYVSLLSETAEKVLTETGGIFLGHRNGDTWYVIETIDPGPSSIFQPAYFEYDQGYVTHLTNKIARVYKKPLQLIGLWHRHPGSFCQFSGTDDGTNKKFASLHEQGAISALVNIDPDFRLTVFHVSQPLSYHRVAYEVNDSLIPQELIALNSARQIERFLSGKESSPFLNLTTRALPRLKYSRILNEILCNLDSLDITEHISKGKLEESLDDYAIEKIIGEIERDMEFLGRLKLDMSLQHGQGFVRLSENTANKSTLDFYLSKNSERCILGYKNRYFLYVKGMMRAVIEDIINIFYSSERNFKLNKEFVECSISRLRKK